MNSSKRSFRARRYVLMMSNFGAQVEAMAKKYQSQMRAAMRESVQATVSLAQRIEAEGGRMRVDTGFLRASVNASVGAMPTGISVNPDPKAKGKVKYTGEGVGAAITRWQPGETLYIGWTANYARPREYRDGFLRGAVEQWDGTVKSVAARIKQRI